MRRKLVLPVLGALGLAVLGCGAGSCASSPDEPVVVDEVEVPIRNFVKVDEKLYRGAQPDAAGYEALRRLGVKTIVNLRAESSDREEAERHGFQVVEIPMHAAITCDPPSEQQLDLFLDTVLDEGSGPVYVHCAHGRDRTGTMCAVYRMEKDRWSPEKAYAEMRERGFRTWYQDFSQFVQGYQCRRSDLTLADAAADSAAAK